MEGKNRMEQGNVLDGLHEECGVFGIYDFDGGNVASSDILWSAGITAQRAGKLRYCRQGIRMVQRKSDDLQRHGTGK